jgi:peptidoglycan-N-acetylglucosamine deacetylase
MRLCALSVDLDEVPCYAAIYGLPPPGGDHPSAHAIYRNALPRWEALCDQLGIRATFFAIGSDMKDAQAAQAIARLHAAGHEIGNHSFHHRYDLTRMPRDVMREDVEAGMAALTAVTGERPLGFRAPGYVVSDTLFQELESLGVLYDSSVFPCPAYYTAKALAISWIRMRGRSSRSIVDDPRVLMAPADPYRIGRPYYRRGQGLLELPIGVTSERSGRLPFIGTYIVLGGSPGALWLARQVRERPLVNLEAHGIDLADADEDGLAFLRPHQVELKRDVRDKRAALESAIWTLRGAGYEFVTLSEAARRFGQESGG